MKPYLFALLFAANCSVCSAAAIYANGLPDLDSANARAITMFRSADDFVLASSWNMESIRFWMVAVDDPPSFSGSITYAIYQNSGGNLGGLVQSATVNGIAAGAPDPITQFIYSMYVVNFNLPAPHEGPNLTTSDASPDVYWALVNGVSGNAKQNPNPAIPANSVGEELAFTLNGTAAGVPEPGTIPLCLIGLGALGIWQRRQRQLRSPR